MGDAQEAVRELNNTIPEDEDGVVHFNYVDTGSTEWVEFMGVVVWSDQDEGEFSREKLIANVAKLIGKAAYALDAIGLVACVQPAPPDEPGS